MKIPESTVRPTREPAAKLVTPEKPQSDASFRFEKDVDPYWEKMVESVKRRHELDPHQIHVLCQLVRLYPKRRSSLQELLSEEQWPFYKERIEREIAEYELHKEKRHRPSQASLYGMAQVITLFPDHRTDVAAIDQSAGDCIQSIKECMQDHNWDHLPIFVESFLILFPERRSDIPLHEIEQAFLEHMGQVDPMTHIPHFTKWLKDSDFDSIAFMCAFFPEIKKNRVLYEQVRQKFQKALKAAHDKELWPLYLNAVLGIATVSADDIVFDAKGMHLVFEQAHKQPAPLPDRSVV